MFNQHGFKSFEHTPNKIQVYGDQDSNILEHDNSKIAFSQNFTREKINETTFKTY